MEKYKKIKLIGKGGFGIVYLCERISDHRRLVIKQIPVNELSSDDRQAALNEALVHSMLNHPNIVSYHDSCLEDKHMIIAMEYAEGGTLCEYLVTRKKQPLTEEEALNFFVQLVLALQHVHSRKILHRDLKTQNILLNKTKDIIKVADFGISKILITKSKAQTVLGTPHYISPELCEGKPYCETSDIWALGCVFYELLTLRRPFEADNSAAIVMKIMKGNFDPLPSVYSWNVKQLVSNMLHLDPKKRPSTAHIMAQPFIVPFLFKAYSQAGCLPCMPGLFPLPPVPREDRINSVGSSSSDEFPYINFKKGMRAWFIESGSSIPRSFDIPFISFNNNLARMLISQIKRKFQISFQQSGICAADFSNVSGRQYKRSPANVFEKSFIRDVIDCTIGSGFALCLSRTKLVFTVGKVASACLGYTSECDIEEPKVVDSVVGHNIVSIDCGPRHVLVVSDENEVFAWGHGNKGCLGLGKIEYQSVPKLVKVMPNYKITRVFCGADSSFAITTEKFVLACGSNRHNKLGMDTEDGFHIDYTRVFQPVRSQPLPKLLVARVAPGKSHTAVLTVDGQVYTFGSNRNGQLGWGSCGLTHNMPGQIKELSQVSVLTSGDLFTMAITHKGECFLWGKGPNLVHQQKSTQCQKLNDLPFLENEILVQAAAHQDDIIVVSECED